MLVAMFAVVAFGCGGGGGQPMECKKYIDCLNAVSAGSGDSIKASYGEMGTCWSTGGATADTCKKACVDGLAAQAMAANAPAACK
jgi:hypothetical protein